MQVLRMEYQDCFFFFKKNYKFNRLIDVSDTCVCVCVCICFTSFEVCVVDLSLRALNGHTFGLSVCLLSWFLSQFAAPTHSVATLETSKTKLSAYVAYGCLVYKPTF